MKAYKGFDKDMKCRGFQFEEGKTYTAEGEIKVCENGFHACENPLDVLHYYSIANGSKYHMVECDGDMSKESDGESKFACREITIGAEITVGQLIKAGLKAIFDRVGIIDVSKTEKYTQGNYSTAATQGNYSTAATQGWYSTAATQGWCSTAATQGNYSTAATQGWYSTAATQGWYSTAATQGNYSTAATQGNYSTAMAMGCVSVALANGYQAKAKAALGSYIVVTEWADNGKLIDCQCHKVDDKKVKADTFYILKEGQLVEV